jgi:hypothetical protein
MTFATGNSINAVMITQWREQRRQYKEGRRYRESHSSSKITKPPKSFGREPTPSLIRVKKTTAKGRKTRTIKAVEIRASAGDSSQGSVQPTAQDDPQFRLFPK